MTSNLCAGVVFLELVVIFYLSSFVFFFIFFLFHHVLFLVINVLTNNELYYQNHVDAKALCYNDLVDTEKHVTQYKSCQP